MDLHTVAEGLPIDGIGMLGEVKEVLDFEMLEGRMIPPGTGRGAWVPEGMRESAVHREGAVDPQLRLADMDTEGIDVAVLYGVVSLGFYALEDRELATASYWSEDRLHMNARGHHRVAARVLTALGFEPPAAWWSLPPLPAGAVRGAAYYRQHVGPWVRRRLTGTSSGDGRAAKFGEWADLTPADAPRT